MSKGVSDAELFTKLNWSFLDCPKGYYYRFDSSNGELLEEECYIRISRTYLASRVFIVRTESITGEVRENYKSYSVSDHEGMVYSNGIWFYSKKKKTAARALLSYYKRVSYELKNKMHTNDKRISTLADFLKEK